MSCISDKSHADFQLYKIEFSCVFLFREKESQFFEKIFVLIKTGLNRLKQRFNLIRQLEQGEQPWPLNIAFVNF